MDVEVIVRVDGEEVASLGRSVEGDAAEREEVAIAVGREVGRVLTRQGLNELLRGGDRPCCCGEPMSRWGRATRTLVGLCGPVRVEGRRFRCARCRREVRSTDTVGFRGHGVTVPLARRVCRLAISEHFTELEEMLLEQHGVRLGHDLIAKLVHEAGGVADRQRREEAAAFERESVARRRPPEAEIRPRTVIVSCDAIHYCTNLLEPHPQRPGQNRLLWHQMKVGCVYWQDANGRWRKRVLWGRDDPEEFGRSLYLLACRCGWREAEERVFAADGAAWCWAIRDLYFSDGVPVLDWFHAAENVWAAAHRVAGDDARTWSKPILDRLYEEGGRSALGLLRHLRRDLRGPRRQAVADLIRYLEGHADRTEYPACRARGWPIGTGMIESTAKQLVATRLKGPGMHWSDEGAVAVTALRAQQLNRGWSKFWKHVNTAA
jgi:hypothetical protein